jgi:hypothetical protein
MTCDRAFAQAEVNGEWVTVCESVDLLTYRAAIHGSETPRASGARFTQTSFLIFVKTKTYAGRYFICICTIPRV